MSEAANVAANRHRFDILLITANSPHTDWSVLLELACLGNATVVLRHPAPDFGRDPRDAVVCSAEEEN
ncbi:hypothetical protein SPRG_19261, partial [Saprolegnia parasitica CBS 223.65]